MAHQHFMGSPDGFAGASANRELTRKTRLMLMASGCVALIASLAGQPAPEPIAITEVTIVDLTAGDLLPNRTVIFAGDRIRRVIPEGEATPSGARLIDGRGKFLIPGLWDMHVHLSYARASALPAFIAHGVTVVRDLGSRLAEIDKWRGQISAGGLAGPEIVRAGPMLNGHESNRYQLAVTTATDATATVRAMHKAGVDVIKVHRRISRDAYFAVAEEAKRLALPLAGHIPMTVTPAEAAATGQSTFEHAVTLFEGTFSANLDESALPDAIQRWRRSPAADDLFATLARHRTVVDPTLVTLRRLNAWLADPKDVRDRYIAASAWREAEGILAPLRKDAANLLAYRRALARELEAVVGQLHRAGVRLVSGTDTSFTLLHPGFSLHDEIEALADAGLTPIEALRASIVTPSELFPALAAGGIEAGKRADLLLLDANPVADIRNVRRIHAVVAAGRVYDRAALDKLLEEAAAQAAVQ